MIKKAVIWGTRRSGTTYLQDLFCSGLGVQERDRARFSESFSYSHYEKYTKLFAPYLIPNLHTFRVEWLPGMLNEIKYREPCFLKLHFDNSPNIPTEILDFLFENYTNIIVYREDWWEQVTSLALSHITNNWHNRPGIAPINEQPTTIDKKTWDWCQQRLIKSYDYYIIDINAMKDKQIISYEDMVNSMDQLGHVFGMSKTNHIKMMDKKKSILNYDEVRSWTTENFTTQWFTLNNGKLTANEELQTQ